MREIGRVFGRIFGQDPEAAEAREKYEVVLAQARELARKLERELREKGSSGVFIYEGDLRLFPGREIRLSFDLRSCPRSDINSTGWESKCVNIGVLRGSAGAMFGFSAVNYFGFGRTLWLEESISFIQMANLRAQAAEEGKASSPTFTLEEQARFAIDNAQYVTDARYDRSLD